MAEKTNILKDFYNLSFPKLCAACRIALHDNEKYLCTNCRLSLPLTNFHLTDENPIIKMFWGRIPIVFATSYFYFSKESRVQNLIHHIKYHGFKELAMEIGQLMGQAIRQNSDFSNSVDVIVPVPLHPKKLKIRGFNQSEYIARGLSIQLKKTISTDNLIRVIHSPSQTRKSRYRRWENVSGIFEVKDKTEFHHKHILLVDDVITTGSTVEACFSAFQNCNNIKFSLASIAFAHDK